MNRNRLIVLIAATLVISTTVRAADGSKDGWISLFDGKSLKGWIPSENQDSWQIVDGALAAKGPRSHLFYGGSVSNHRFKNFELSVDVKAEGNANAGIYFHTEYQEEGWPSKGFEFQVINSTFTAFETRNNYIERKKTGSLYGVRNIGRSPVRNDEWFNYRIIVRGKTIRGFVNGRLMVDYTEPDKPHATRDGSRVLSDGTFAFQCHDPHSVVLFRNVKVRPLPTDVKTPGKPLDDELEYRLRKFGSSVNLPTADFHVHLTDGLTAERLLKHARKYGFTYGVAVAAGPGTRIKSDANLRDFMDGYDRRPETYLGLQAEGRKWSQTFAIDTRKRFDYVFADVVQWADGKKVGDREKFMDQLVKRIEAVASSRIDFLANATYLPASIREDYDELWTDARMDRVIKALLENEVAVEINARRQIPSAEFVKKAKAAGLKFTFGTDNTGANDLGRLDYCLRLAAECRLKRKDFWFPDR
ncbi:MAG: hypothetical protein CMO80_23025 [Verrucomicrobiales bacterium]|nr:hypothetical protein [Verrucomicrobiales bacterium]|tara:strand:- start:3351 stop:4769 length:1419 start_codon:yes stop_codon:yes gene_type:complete